ncbi:MAG: DUF2877 domain-containing protein [Bacillota bacterium]
MQAFSVGIGAWQALSASFETGATVVSVARRSLYCQAGTDLLCVGSEAIERGPINILLNDDDWKMLRGSVTVGTRLKFKDNLACGPMDINWSKSIIFAAKCPEATGVTAPQANLKNLWNLLYLQGKGPVAETVGYLLGRQGLTSSDPVMNKVKKKIVYSLKLLKKGWQRPYCRPDLAEAVKNLLGLGPGLTPLGDDFLVGYLSGLTLVGDRNGVSQGLRSELRVLIIDHLAQTNEISQAHLRWACAGYYTEPLILLLTGLAEGNQRHLHPAIINLLQRGATSGTDTAAGLLWALEHGKEMHNGYSMAH